VPARGAGAANRTGVALGKRFKAPGRDGDETGIRALETMLDYAIIEGAELRLPLFVLLLRTARLELMTSIGASGGPRDGRVETKITDCLGADAGRSFAMSVPNRTGPAAPTPLDPTVNMQDR
jgi:hypothetical protein